MHQEVRHRRVQMDTHSPRDKVEEGAHFAVKQGGFRQFHGSERDCKSVHSDHLYICAHQSFVYFITEVQRRYGEWGGFWFDNQPAFSGGRGIPLGGSGTCWGSTRPGIVVGFLAFLNHGSPQGGRGWGGGCVPSEGFGSGLTCRFISATLKGIGGGVSGRGVSAFRATISSVTISTISTSASIADCNGGTL